MLLVNDVTDEQLIRALQQGAVGVLPTDTIYGLVCCASDQAAVTRLYHTKQREAKPGTIIAASIDQLVALGIPRRYLVPVQEFWPNPLSVIVPTGADLTYLDKGLKSLAVRIPKDTKLTHLLEQTGPLLTTSANMPGRPVAQSIAEAKAYFGDQVDFYVDGGAVRDAPASTIIRIVDDEIEILRQGAVKLEDLV